MDATTTDAKTEAIERLHEIRHEIEELVGEAMDCVKEADGFVEQAERYWKAHIIGALRNDHGYLGGSMITMQDTIEGIEYEGEEEEE